MVKRLLLIVTLPGPDNESKRNPVAPPALSVNVLLAIHSRRRAQRHAETGAVRGVPIDGVAGEIDLGRSQRSRSARPCRCRHWTGIRCWTCVIVDIPEVEALLTNRPVLPPPLTVNSE